MIKQKKKLFRQSPLTVNITCWCLLPHGKTPKKKPGREQATPEFLIKQSCCATFALIACSFVFGPCTQKIPMDILVITNFALLLLYTTTYVAVIHISYYE